jgi:6-phosphogluconolactonase
MVQIHHFDDEGSLAQGAAEFVIELGRTAQEGGGVFSLALSGGSTPKATYQRLAVDAARSGLDWDRVRIFWGDERCVPPDDPASNYRMARLAMLDHVPVPESNVFRMACEGDPEQGAIDYEASLREQFGAKSLPRFDLILLGLGPDGHTASLFPGSSALESGGRWVLANYVEKMAAWRMTLSLEVINGAAAVAFLVQGDEKSGVLRDVVEGSREGASLPAAQIRPQPGELHWFVDAAAGKQLVEA